MVPRLPPKQQAAGKTPAVEQPPTLGMLGLVEGPIGGGNSKPNGESLTCVLLYGRLGIMICQIGTAFAAKEYRDCPDRTKTVSQELVLRLATGDRKSLKAGRCSGG